MIVTEIHISKTEEGVITYPLHRHGYYEVMLYLDGTGVLVTDGGDFPFVPGSILIVPPGVLHGSSSKNGFCNISIGGDFGALCDYPSVVPLSDTPDGEGRTLAELIHRNRFRSPSYLAALCDAYLHFLSELAPSDQGIGATIRLLADRISEGACSPDFSLSGILRSSGYAEDYIRAAFRREMGKTPIAFRNDLRIRRACALIERYGTTLPLSEIAARCGFADYVYFSKKFRAAVGLSPAAYAKERQPLPRE